jgi:hypothetical protein
VKKYAPSLYLTDSWKTTRKLTLNYGLRWEPDVPEILKAGSVQYFSEAQRAAGFRSTGIGVSRIARPTAVTS